MHYDKWMRFENFLKFAERKELKDRMKELDPPSLLNYVDPSTIDAIKKHRKDPASLVKKPGKEVPPEKAASQALKDNQARIQKMKELYGLFVRMENEKDQKQP